MLSDARIKIFPGLDWSDIWWGRCWSVMPSRLDNSYPGLVVLCHREDQFRYHPQIILDDQISDYRSTNLYLFVLRLHISINWSNKILSIICFLRFFSLFRSSDLLRHFGEGKRAWNWTRFHFLVECVFLNSRNSLKISVAFVFLCPNVWCSIQH